MRIVMNPAEAKPVTSGAAFKAGPDAFNLWRIVQETGATSTPALLLELQHRGLSELEWRCGQVLAASEAAGRIADPKDSRDYFLLCAEWRVVRMRVLARLGGKCQCCGRTAKDGVVINVDHIKPRRQYPELALDETNLQVLCDACNQGKGNWNTTDWRTGAHAA